MSNIITFIDTDKMIKGYLDITIDPKWEYIPLIKTYIEGYLLINLVSKIAISKISMTASELLENAVKYSNKEGIRLMLKKIDKTNQIRLIVYNFAAQKDALELINIVENMKKNDPLEYYIDKMKESAIRTDGKSCLGIARINYEGEARIFTDYFNDEGIVQVKTIFDL